VPLNRTADLSRIIKASEILRQKMRREPTPEELSELTGLSVDVVQSLAALNTGDVRLDAPMDPEGDRSLIERFVADEMPDTEEEDVDPPRRRIAVGDRGTGRIGKSSRVVHPAECIHCVECESHPPGGNADSHIEPRVATERNRVGVIDERAADGADEKTAAQSAPETQIRPSRGHRLRDRLQLVAVELALSATTR